ncbi:hypothetical protein CARUB_v10021764mg, partial [Capsella rubella]
ERTSAADVNLCTIWEACQWQLALGEKRDVTPQPRTEAELEVHFDAWVCFSDGSWSVTDLIGDMGWIIHDPHSSTKLQGAFSTPLVTSDLIAESLALLAGVEAAKASSALRLACFSDCLELVVLLNSGAHVNEIEGIVADIHLDASSFLSISFHHVPRNKNLQADTLALLSCNLLIRGT